MAASELPISMLEVFLQLMRNVTKDFTLNNFSNCTLLICALSRSHGYQKEKYHQNLPTIMWQPDLTGKTQITAAAAASLSCATSLLESARLTSQILFLLPKSVLYSTKASRFMAFTILPLLLVMPIMTLLFMTIFPK